MKKTSPTRRRDDASRAAAQFGEQLRQYFHGQQVLAGIRRRKRRKEPITASRGVDRVPDQLVGLTPSFQWIHLHTSPSRAMVRGTGARRGRINKSYVNPMRDVKAMRSGRLRKELLP